MATSLLTFFIPQNKVFFGLFNQASANNIEMADMLYKAVSAEVPHEETLLFNQINRLKIKGNELKHQVYLESAKAFVSPFERNDMYALASSINSICDHIHVSSRRISLYRSDYISTPSVKELCGLVIETCMELDKAVRGLDNLINSDLIIACCNKIKQLEHYADQVCGKAISSIMINETNSVELIKYTEILSALEITTDKCEDATPVIESIIIKNK
ncbi:DUF47 domain-containing protein [Mucilaginibacter segetis]|uniref:DUF47 family protein n=1 Tax=Mucilaginibacter segetis TaxID=2793071 RepID=A0A934PTT1_9SPHI|nr:DUF47 family protein [Mucilaginibacter segetis]MBK0379904.1 DUF47 family protein [Mucilaginibacter segetis]